MKLGKKKMPIDNLSEHQAHPEAAHPTEPIPEELTKLTVNGDTYELYIEPEWTLAEVLRKKLRLMGTKVACDDGACGACTVLVDGETTLSCMTLAVECEGREITTIEGLADGNKLHPIQEAFKENFGFACGFCTPGIIMATKALLDKNPSPSKEEVTQALSGNLCRCTGYVNIIESVLAAADKMKGR